MVAGGAEGASVGTWTVLFTDQVGSTEMRVRVGEDAFDRIRADLDTRISAALVSHGAAVTKSMGDGVMAGFTSTAAAVRCAVAIQQAVDERNRRERGTEDDSPVIAIRVGISVGDAALEEADLHGTVVVEAARLCAAARGGMSLCSDAVRLVSANRSGCRFGPAISLQLKGLPDPVDACEVLWEPLPYRDSGRGVRFAVLGPLEVTDDDRHLLVRGKEQRLLALLLARVNTPVSVDSLVGALWSGIPPRTANRTVHAYVARLRRTLEPRRPRREASALLMTVGRGYELRVDADQLDAGRFEELAGRGRAELKDGDRAAASTLREALQLWRGEAFGEFRDIETCAVEASRLEELHLGLVEDRLEADLAADAEADLVGEIEALLHDHPFRERLWGLLIIALYRSGRQREALDAYQRARRLLTEELGIEPGPDLRRLEAAVLAQDSSLEAQRPSPPTAGSLPAILASVGPAFEGRDSELGRLHDAWVEAAEGRGGFVSVLGPEGIGKTRLVAELARCVYDEGAAVLYGRCDHAHRGAWALLDQALEGAGSSMAVIGSSEDDHLAEALARWLPSWSRGRPVLVVLDDLHLADADTLEVVADFASWCRSASILVVGAFRSDPSLADVAEQRVEPESQVVLTPLADDVVARLCAIYAEADTWTPDDVKRIVELSGGIPLLVHEQASQWARDRARDRMSEMSRHVVTTRRRLAASRSEIAESVEGIQRLMEQRRAQLAGREARVRERAVAALGACPYKGLVRFEAPDAAVFFGRERLVAELVGRMAETSFLVVVGPSGSGKSSLVRAGLLPALADGLLSHDRRWQTAILCPGDRPTEALATTLNAVERSRHDEPSVLFVDQFEELFTAGADHHDQAEFVDRLLAFADQPDTAVVIAVRADHLGECGTLPGLADRMTGDDILVGPMRPSELRRTVELPAQRAGLEIEHGLVEVIVTDVAGRAGALPLLSTALAETWERREARTLTLVGYRAAGGVNGAIARMAEDAYTSLSGADRAAARRLLLRLCDIGDDRGTTFRRRLPIAQLVDDDDVHSRTALEVLADRRLLTIDTHGVELAHEALLREWPRMRAWLDEDVQGRRLHRRLHDAAQAWETNGRDPSDLYRGSRLGAALDWAADHDDDLNRLERAFLADSRRRGEQELADARRLAADRERSNRRLRGLLLGIGVFLVGALVAGALAVRANGAASHQAAVARARAHDADVARLIGDSHLQRTTRRDVSLLLALEAQRLGGGAEASSALFSTLESAPGFLGNIGADQRAPAFTSAAVTADNHLVVGDAAGRLVQFDMATHRRLGHPVQVGDRGEQITLLETDPAGRHLVVGLDASRAIYLFDSDALSALRPEGGGSGLAVELADVPSTIAVSADGAVAVSGRDTGTVTVLDVGTGAIRATIPAARGPTSVAIAPDGTLAIGSSEGITLLERDTYTPLASFSGDGIAADGSLQFSADGARLLSGERTTGGAARYDILTTLAVWDVRQHRELWRSSSDARCFDTAIVASNVVCSGRSPALAFELDTGRPSPSVLSAHPGFTQDLAISPDHTTLVVGGRNLPVAYEFSLDGRSAVGQLVGRPGTYPVNYSPDGKTIMTESGTTSVGNSPALGPRQIWDTATADLIDNVNVLAGVYAPDGRIAALLDDLTFALIDPDTGKRTPITPGPSLEITYIAFDASQSRVAIGLADGSVHQRDLRTGEPTGAVIGTADVGVSAVAYVRAGAVIAVARADQIEFFDSDNGRSVLEPLPGRSVTASADGSILVTVDPNGNIAVRDPTTGRRDGTSMVAAADAPNHFLSLSDDNKRLLVTSGDGTVRLFDLTTHDQIGDVIPLSIVASNVGHIGGVIRPDGRQMALATENGVQLWDLDPSEWRKAACQLAGRNLTQAEWDRYLPPTEPYHETCPGWR